MTLELNAANWICTFFLVLVFQKTHELLAFIMAIEINKNKYTMKQGKVRPDRKFIQTMILSGLRSLGLKQGNFDKHIKNICQNWLNVYKNLYKNLLPHATQDFQIQCRPFSDQNNIFDNKHIYKMSCWRRFEPVPDIKTRAARLVSQLSRPARQTTSQSRVHSVAPTSQKFFVGASNKKAKLIILQITGMTDDATKKLCEKCLLSVSKILWFSSFQSTWLDMMENF